jgi:hypothetical protein
VAYPGVAAGSIAGEARSDNFYSGHIDFQEVFLTGDGFRLSSLLGYSYLRFDDSIVMRANIMPTGGVFVPGTQLQTLDKFAAQNDLHSLDLGLRAEIVRQRWSLGVLAKLAVGDMFRDISIGGGTRVAVPGAAPLNFPGGFLALASNSGSHETNQWLVVPELAADLGWDINNHLRLRLGYSVLFWSKVARSSDQVNLLINPNLFPPVTTPNPTPNSPFFEQHKSELWVQTFNIGLEFRY